MKRWVLILAAIAVSPFYGCNMCCGPYDFDYPTSGGVHQRANPAKGRVGSIFSDPFAPTGPSADSNLAPETPQKYDEPSSSEFDGDDDDLDRELEKELRDRMNKDETDGFEAIEPELDDEADDTVLMQPGSVDDSTAYERWRPRPLRGSQQWR